MPWYAASPENVPVGVPAHRGAVPLRDDALDLERRSPGRRRTARRRTPAPRRARAPRPARSGCRRRPAPSTPPRRRGRAARARRSRSARPPVASAAMRRTLASRRCASRRGEPRPGAASASCPASGGCACRCRGPACRTATRGRSPPATGSCSSTAGWHEPGSLRDLERALEQVGLALEHVRLLVCTHAHIDHCGQAAAVQERSGCELWMHPRHEHLTAALDDREAALARRIEIARQSGVPEAPLQAWAEGRREQGTGMSGPLRAGRDLVPGVVVEIRPRRLARATRRPATRRRTSCCTSPSAGCCSPATTCSAASRSTSTTAGRRTRSASSSPRSTSSTSSTSRLTPVRPRAPVHRRARPRRGQPRAGARAARRASWARCASAARRPRSSCCPAVYGDKLAPETAAWLLTKTLCYLEHLEARRAPCGASRASRALDRRLDSTADADRRADSARAPSRPSPSSSSRRRPTRASATCGRALAELSRLEPDVRVGHLRRGGQHDREAQDDRHRPAPQARLRHGGDGALHVRRRDRRRAARDARPMRDAGIENVLALRGDPPQGQDEWTATEGGLELLARADRADPRRVRLRDRRRVLPRDAHPRDRSPRATCATSRRRSTPARAS